MKISLLKLFIIDKKKTMKNERGSINFQMSGCQKWKPVVVILAVYFVMAVLNFLFKKILDKGKSHLVIITYRLTTAAIFLMPVAYFHERYTTSLFIKNDKNKETRYRY